MLKGKQYFLMKYDIVDKYAEEYQKIKDMNN